ncbi:helix-turn-helix domain-containing protein [Clostridioides sp. ES-W-0016-02]|uniref:helix-turn-helix domain-containing protein n=1 Tax=Clostridioides sp. ES-W-0016-02 TaxID=2770788 RepID=UPI001D12E366|nr:helix-turn-helix transcriptional regulator [Clostridioides sp. ES-W-0016-02]
MLNKKVGLRIKQFRIKKAITQIELSKLIGISQAEISRIENSATQITLYDLEKISKALDVTIASLIN